MQPFHTYLRQIIGFLGALLLVLTSVAFFSSCLASLSPYFEFLSHARFIYIFLFVIAFVLLLLTSYRWLALLAAALLSFSCIDVAKYLFPYQPPSKVTSHVRIVQMNLWGGKNREYQEAVKVARDTNPDVIALTENTQQWGLTFSKAFPDYKYQIVEPHYGGIAILSRLPLEAPEIRYFSSIKRPRIHARLMLANGSYVSLLFVHPVIPLYRNQLRDKEFIVLSQEINDDKNPKILFGDFNCSPWSPVYARLLRTTQLADTQQGFGLQPSWGPHWCPVPIIPIDHYLISSDLITLSRFIGPDFGSDHRPVIIDIGLPESGTKSLDN